MDPQGASSTPASNGAGGLRSTEQTITLVGARIRALRLRQGLTLREIAQRTGVSVSMLSMLERGVASASVGTLVSVASALGVHMYDLFDHPEPERESPVTRRAEQSVVHTSEGATRRIAHHDPRSGIEMAVNEYAPGSASGPRATHHRGREFGLVVSGTLRVELGDEEHDLGAGDVIAYPSTRPHRISNAGDAPAVAVWINIDPD
ncbi:cupin domain-containing protein [Phytohabitans suffuscus]|uniref:DNA-binding protein n=1 Tax=Phytohabitans suffuscus TaxID=624315 RepID=A0A6F8YSE4_9ACTN|nr:cupin domain-containing protein [Phytohabitans suffuscus]BCB88751.1 DNA-binding protein [Phytohabitans suffuscus]